MKKHITIFKNGTREYKVTEKNSLSLFLLLRIPLLADCTTSFWTFLLSIFTRVLQIEWMKLLYVVYSILWFLFKILHLEIFPKSMYEKPHFFYTATCFKIYVDILKFIYSFPLLMNI